MDVKNKNQIGRISSYVGGLFASVWLGFWAYCYLVAPRQPAEDLGRVFELDNHGTILYLTKFEYYTFYGIPVTFFMFGLISYFYLKIKRR
jgi:hypothetical protein